MQSAPDTVEGSRCGQSIGRMRPIDWPHRERLVGASADCINRKLVIFFFGLSTIAERVLWMELVDAVLIPWVKESGENPRMR